MSCAKKLLRTLQRNPNPSLPDDLLLNIVAHVSRLYYPTLSLVSKGFRSLLASPELYKARSFLNHTENCLYVCLLGCSGYRWFTLCRKPNQTLTNDTSDNNKKKKSSGYVLATVPIPHSPHEKFSSLVAGCSNMYNIGGFILPSSSVSILDCRSHTWHEAPSLRVKLILGSACVVDKKIYVRESCEDGDSNYLKNTIECFNTETQIWDPVPIPCCETKYNFKSACIDGKLHLMSGSEVIAYNAKEGRWDLVAPMMSDDMLYSDAYCTIENVLYSVFLAGLIRILRWYGTKDKMWRELKGMVELPMFTRNASVRLANYGGKIAVLWDEKISCAKKIWCAEITLERRNRLEIWGNVEWFDRVFSQSLYYIVSRRLLLLLFDETMMNECLLFFHF